MNSRFHLHFHKLLFLGLFILALVVVGLAFSHSSHPKSAPQTRITLTSTSEINLLNQTWAYMPDVTRTANGLHVTPTDFRIVEQDGSGGQANPPLNLYGTYLRNSGNFQISASMKNIRGSCSLQFYASPPVIADEFRIEPPSIRLTTTANNTQVQAWDGLAIIDLANQQPFYSKTLGLGAITLNKTASGITVKVGSQSLNIPGNVLDSGSVWLGLDSSSGGCDISSFTAQGSVTAVDATKKTYIKASSGLRALASAKQPGFKIGAAVALGPIVSDQTYANELTNNFSSITPENLMKWQFIEPAPGQFSFQQADALVDFALRNGMVIHGHTLVFSEANPKWVQDLPTATTADKQAVQSVMLNHISTVVGHYKGKVASWDVVNEPLQDYDTFDPSSGQILRNNKWYQAMGSNYIALAFRAAHQADPGAKLYINEYGLEAGGERWDSFLSLVKNLKTAGVPIDGVGFESHVYDSGDIIDPAVLRSHIDQLAQLGLHSSVSEMDVYDDDGLAVQAQQYSSVFGMCLADTNCVSFTTWGVDDRYDVYQDDNHQLQFGNDLLFNQGAETPAYQAIQASLNQK